MTNELQDALALAGPRWSHDNDIVIHSSIKHVYVYSLKASVVLSPLQWKDVTTATTVTFDFVITLPGSLA